MNVQEKVEQVLKRLAAQEFYVYDVETSGLDWRKCHAVGHVFTFGPRPDDSYYLPVRHLGGGNIDGCSVPQTLDGWDGSIHPLETALVKAMDTPRLRMGGHNLAFDLKFLYRLGFRFKSRCDDSQINAVLIDEHQQSVSLDFCGKVYKTTPKRVTIYDYIIAKFGAEFPELRANPKKAMGHFWRLAGDDPQPVEYAEGDGTTTWEVIEKQGPCLDAQELRRVWDVECRLIPILARMTTRGVRVDEERLNQVRDIVRSRRDEALRALPENFNSRAPTQVRALMEANGHTNWPLTPKGSPSFTEAFLKTNEVGCKIIAARQYAHLEDSFIAPMIEYHLWNGRVHSEYNQLRGDEFGTITGRLSSSNPNLQQIPKRNKELSQLYRSIFIPDNGKMWSSTDYSQCEPRLLAYYSGSKVLTEGYLAKPSVDAHTAVTRAMNLSKGWDDWDKERKKLARENGKRVNQTLITGGGKKVICDKYGVDPKEVDQIWDDYFKAMPEVRSLQKRAARRWEENGFVYSLLGRRSRLTERRFSYAAVNRLLQMGNADLIKLKIVELQEFYDSEGADVDILNNVHDALDQQFSEDNREVYERGLQLLTDFGPESALPITIPMEIETGEGRNWSVATWGEDENTH